MLEDNNFSEEILRMNKLNKKKTGRAKLSVEVWTEMIYYLWMQHNKKSLITTLVILKMLLMALFLKWQGGRAI